MNPDLTGPDTRNLESEHDPDEFDPQQELLVGLDSGELGSELLDKIGELAGESWDYDFGELTDELKTRLEAVLADSANYTSRPLAAAAAVLVLSRFDVPNTKLQELLATTSEQLALLPEQLEKAILQVRMNKSVELTE